MTIFRRKASNLGLLVLSLATANCGGLEATGNDAALGTERGALSSSKERTPKPLDTSAATPTTGLSAHAQALMSQPKEKAYIEARLREQAAPPGPQTSAIWATAETLQQYAAKCEDATGIRIPPFSCENGFEVQEGTERVNLGDNPIGISVWSRSLDTSTYTTTMTARGTDIYGTSDQFLLSPIPTAAPALVSGNGSLEIKVLSVTNTDPYTKAGIMFRSSAAANATNVSIFVTPGHGISFQRRTTTGGTTTTTELAGRTAPQWLRLTRSGSTFTGFASNDRVTWTQVGTAVTISGFPTEPLAGMALTSHNASVTATATFQSLRWMPSPMNLCDRPNVLNHVCDPGSKFQVLAQNGDAAAVAHCRKEGKGTGRYGDIAIIQYNKSSGGLCFYQALDMDRDLQPIGDGQGLDGTNVPAPIVSSTATNFRWYNPAEVNDVGCPSCHDSGGFIRSPYLVQTGLLPNWDDGYDNDTTNVQFPGYYFSQDRNWWIYTDNASTDAGDNCTSCHRLSVNNRSFGDGTGANFAQIATADQQSHKNPHDVLSPIWMRKGQITFDEGAYDTALKYSDCATGFWRDPNVFGAIFSPGFTDGNRTGDVFTAGCTYSPAPVGQPFFDPVYNDFQIGITNGTRTQSGSQNTITVRGSDIYGTSDQFLFALQQFAQDGMATVKVNSITNSNAFAKAGLMLRNNIAANSAHVMVHITPTSGAQFQYRLTDGATTTASTPLTPRSAPVWLRLYKTGTVVSGWVSNDYLTWNQVAPAVNVPGLAPYIGMAATSHSTTASTTAVFDRYSWVTSVDALADANIGVLGGTRTLSAGNRLITVAGSDIYGTSDQFFFTFKQVTNGSYVYTKVNSLTNTDPFAKAGVMMRAGIDANAAHVMVHVTPTSGVQFQYRTSAGASAVSNTPIAGKAAPIWLSLQRVGNVFTGYYSLDNVNWTQVGTVTIASFPTTLLEGVAVTSHNTGSATTASIGNVRAF